MAPALATDLLAVHPAIDVRPADPQHDAIDGVSPSAIVEPHSAEGVAAVLAWASEHDIAVAIRGSGTKIDWGRRPDRLDAIVDMRRLDRIVAHRSGDLTVTVEPGVTLASLNAALAEHAQWLPLDPPAHDRATIGGLLATNDSGPLRHRFGTPRDLVLGVRLATTDGQLAKAGGHVVKNVAGYDLSKLVSGSFGGLAAIVEATFKLLPVWTASRTLLIDVPDALALETLVANVTSSQLEPVAFELRVSGAKRSISCLLRFASIPAAVHAQASEACALVAACACTVRTVDGDEERQAWRDHAAAASGSEGAVVRASWLPASVRTAVDAIDKIEGLALVELTARAGLGSGSIRLEGSVAAQAAAIAQLRASDALGNVVVARATPALKSLIDVWGPMGDRARLLSVLKRTLDPAGILSPGRGPL